MEFPLVGLVETNGSNATNGEHLSLYGRQPVVAGLYVGVLGVAAVVGTLGNLAVITTRTTGKDVGRAFIANLALSDLIVTSVINPLAIAGPLPVDDASDRCHTCDKITRFLTRYEGRRSKSQV